MLLSVEGIQMKRKARAKTPPHTGPVKVMTVGELSAYLHVHRSTIYRLLKRYEIPPFHVGGDWRFNVEAIDPLVLRQTNPHRAPAKSGAS
jgi:excisionase family DNA binding protein